MSMSHLNHVNEAKEVTLGIVSPDGRDGMISHAREFAEANIPFVFDPGQGMPMFSGNELLEFVEQATYVTVNDYEAKMLQDKTGKTLDDIAQRVSALIVTLGGDGSLIYCRWQTDIHSDTETACHRRPDRLRRCLSRRFAARHPEGLGLGNHGASGFADGLAQDRQPRRTEPQIHPHRIGEFVQTAFRHHASRCKFHWTVMSVPWT